MKRMYLSARFALMTFTIGMAVVYMFNGLTAFWNEIPVDLPKASSGEILPVFRHDQDWIFRDAETRYKILEERKQARYEYGGRLGCGGVVLNEEAPNCERSVRKARQFIWNHWRERKTGYLIVKLGSEDAESDVHIFIEPVVEGRMQIVWMAERLYGFGIKRGQVNELPKIKDVTYRIADNDDFYFSPGTKFLELVDVTGKVHSL